jgi:broad specificity phosphatase PhoE
VTRILLLRHAEHDWLGRGLAGRLAGVGLNERGQQSAKALVSSLLPWDVSAICSSPQQRALETIVPFARHTGLDVLTAAEFDEIDFGTWTGRTFDDIKARDAASWTSWCERRGSATPPGGEPFAAVWRRVSAGLQRLQRDHRGKTVLVASHGDVIKAALAGVLGLSLDHLERFDIAPGSLSVIEGHRVLRLNA